MVCEVTGWEGGKEKKSLVRLVKTVVINEGPESTCLPKILASRRPMQCTGKSEILRKLAFVTVAVGTLGWPVPNARTSDDAYS